MNKINLEFTSQQAGVLIPLINNDICWLYQWAELTCSETYTKEIKFLDEMIMLLRDGLVMELDIIISVPETFQMALLRLSITVMIARERARNAEDYELYDKIFQVIADGYRRFGGVANERY